MKIREEWGASPWLFKMFTAIAAIDNKNAIGKDGGLLAHIKEDMAHFRSTTLSHTVVMGRKTLESFPNKRPLPKRRNIVLSRNISSVEGAEVVKSVYELLSLLGDEQDVFVIGGGEIYSLLMPYCSTLILTEIDADLGGDVFFPKFDKSEWRATVLSPEKEENGLRFKIVRYDKIIR